MARVRATVRGLAVLLAVSLAACSQPADPAGPGALATLPSRAGPPTAGQETADQKPSEDDPSEDESGPLAPLVGLSTTESVARRTAVAVAVSGTSAGLRGLERADVVYEEFSDVPRWLAVFQSRDATVGPVVATRPMDSMLLNVLHPVYAFDGGPAGMVKQVSANRVAHVDARAEPSLFGEGAGNRTARTAELRDAIGSSAVAGGSWVRAAIPILQYVGERADPAPGMEPARSIAVSLRDGRRQVWSYRAGDRRWHSGAAPELAAANLILQSVRYKSVQVHHPDGPFVPSARIFGSGSAVVATDGRALRGIWRKVGPDRLTTYATERGIIARLVPGPTVVVLVPNSASVRVR